MFLDDVRRGKLSGCCVERIRRSIMDDERDRRIKARAFELWQKEGSLDGRSLSHWLQAEKEIDDEADESVAEDPVILAAAANPTP